jgi:hypothetical protein
MYKSTLNLLFVSLLSVACGVNNPPDSGDSSIDTGDASCATLDADVCSENAECHPIGGLALQEDGSGGLCHDFSDPAEILGCMSLNQGCTGALTYGRPEGSDDQCILFMSGCLPNGWVVCDMYTDECSD